MARIKGVDIPNDKRVEISLTYIYGIGRNLSKTILKNANVDLNKKKISKHWSFLEPSVGLEPTTTSLQGRRSANWATRALYIDYSIFVLEFIEICRHRFQSISRFWFSLEFQHIWNKPFSPGQSIFAPMLITHFYCKHDIF